MSRKLITISTIMTLMSTSVIADVPNVAADIAPIHSLVSRVMDGVGAPKSLFTSVATVSRSRSMHMRCDPANCISAWWHLMHLVSAISRM